MTMHEERREGPRDEPAHGDAGILFVVGQISGRLDSFFTRYENDQENAQTFRKFIRESLEGLNDRVRDIENRNKMTEDIPGRVKTLEDSENEYKEPKKWVRTGFLAALSASTGALIAKWISKLHWG